MPNPDSDLLKMAVEMTDAIMAEVASKTAPGQLHMAILEQFNAAQMSAIAAARQALAMERIANSLEKIAGCVSTTGGGSMPYIRTHEID